MKKTLGQVAYETHNAAWGMAHSWHLNLTERAKQIWECTAKAVVRANKKRNIDKPIKK